MNVPDSQVMPLVGYWCAECCLLDLYQVKTEAEAADLRAEIEDRWRQDGFGLSVWPTLEAAYAALRDDDVLSPAAEVERWAEFGITHPRRGAT